MAPPHRGAVESADEVPRSWSFWCVRCWSGHRRGRAGRGLAPSRCGAVWRRRRQSRRGLAPSPCGAGGMAPPLPLRRGGQAPCAPVASVRQWPHRRA
jgi:hypothetical protein